MRAAVAVLLLCGAASLGGCKNRPDSPSAELASEAEARLARAAYSETAELARHATDLYNNRRAFAGLPRLNLAAPLGAMTTAAKATWGLDRFAAAARMAPPSPPEIAAAQASLADAVEAARTGRTPDFERAYQRKEAISEADAALTLPARFGPEITLLVQRMVAGYAALDDGRVALTPPAQLATEIVRDGRAAVSVSSAVLREGRGGATAELLRDIDMTSLGAYQARWGLGSLSPDKAQRLIEWNRSAEGRAYNNAVLATWSRANDAASIAMLTRFFETMRASGSIAARAKARAG